MTFAVILLWVANGYSSLNCPKIEDFTIFGDAAKFEEIDLTV